MEATKNNVNTFFQNPEVSAEDQLAPLPMEITLTPTETPRISTETAETVNVSAEGENEAERAFVSKCIKHRKEYAPQYSHYSLYRFNDAMFAFGKEAQMLQEYFQNNKYCPLSEVGREHNGEKYLCFHISDYNGDIKGRIRDLMEQKHIAEYGTPSNGLIAVWDAEEVEYWSHSAMPIEPPQSPETPKTVERTTDTEKDMEKTPQNEKKRAKLRDGMVAGIGNSPAAREYV